MNLTRIYVKSKNEVVLRAPMDFIYTACAWIKETRQVLYASDFISLPSSPPIFGILDIESRCLSSLAARSNCFKAKNITMHDRNAVICCSQGVAYFNLLENKCFSLLSLHQLRASAVLGSAVHPNGTIWISAVTLYPFDSYSQLFYYSFSDHDLFPVDLSVAHEQGLVQPNHMVWDRSGKFCYMSCLKSSDIFLLELLKSGHFVRCQRFNFLKLNSELVGLKLDPMGNVFGATKHSVYCWDQYGHLIHKIDAEVDFIVDFIANLTDVILMHRTSWSKVNTSLNNRPVPQDHMLLARV